MYTYYDPYTGAGFTGYYYYDYFGYSQLCSCAPPQMGIGTYTAPNYYTVLEWSWYYLGRTYVHNSTYPAPVITSVSPNIWTAGNTINFTVTGSGFGLGPSLSVSGAGILGSGVYSSSDTWISAWVSLSSGAPPGSATLTVTVNGYGGYFGNYQPTQPVTPNRQATGSAQIVLPTISVTQSPPALNVSTGDTNRTIATTASPSISFTPTFSWGLQSNPANARTECAANLAFSNNGGTGSVNTTVTATPAGCGGIFNALAVVNGSTASSGTTVVVPPQILIQMMYGEAHGQAVIGDNISQLAVGVTARNRFAQPSWFNSVTTYQAALTPQQFGGINSTSLAITNGISPELANAAAVFAGTTNVSVANAGCFFSPTVSDWNALQSALQSGTTTSPSLSLADPRCYQNDRQYVVKQSVGNNADGRGVPAFIFQQLRNPSIDPAVIQIP